MLDRDEAAEISGYCKVPPWGLGLVLLPSLTTQCENELAIWGSHWTRDCSVVRGRRRVSMFTASTPSTPARRW